MKPLILKRDRHIIKIINQEMEKTLRYDLKKMSMQKMDKDGNWICVETQYPFFHGYHMGDIECPEEKFMKLIEKASYLNPTCQSVSTFISRLSNALVYENYIAQGIETECSRSRRRRWGGGERKILTKPLEFYSRHTINFIKKHKVRITVDMERCFINNKEWMERLIEALDYCDINDEQKKEFFLDLTYGDAVYGHLIALIKDYRYDIKSLVNYLFNYLLPFENLGPRDSVCDLADYYRMANTMGRDVKKYPKYLRSMHDIITANFKSFKKEYNEELFLKMQKPELEFEDKKFCVVVPNNSKDIISEGTSLNHCVSSYVDRILNGETYIFFLRETEDKDKSLITLELKNGSVVNAKGSYNRQTSPEERKFLEKYCKKSELRLMI